jgi:quercetin dioxygenase-like cupin family protein
MSSPYGVPTTSTLTRPAVTDRQDGPEGRSFVLRFQPGQKLPDHRNGSRLRIAALAGSGMLMVEGLGTRTLAVGEAVQLEPNVVHSLEAGTEAWEVAVHLIEGCCPGCA